MTTDTLLPDLTGLDEGTLYTMAQAITAELEGRATEKLLTGIKEMLAADAEFQQDLVDLADDADLDEPLTVAKVFFTTWEYENGYFYYPQATMELSNATTYDGFDFDKIDRLLTQYANLVGPLGEHSQLVVNLVTGELDPDD